MTGSLRYLTMLAVGAVVVVLVMGLWNLVRGGSPNRSQALMRMRVLLQLVAVIVLMAFLWFSGR